MPVIFSVQNCREKDLCLCAMFQGLRGALTCRIDPGLPTILLSVQTPHNSQRTRYSSNSLVLSWSIGFYNSTQAATSIWQSKLRVTGKSVQGMPLCTKLLLNLSEMDPSLLSEPAALQRPSPLSGHGASFLLPDPHLVPMHSVSPWLPS